MTARTFAGIISALFLLLAACTPGAGDLGSVAPPPSPADASAPAPSTPATSGVPASGSPVPSAAGTMVVRAYFILGSTTGDGGLVPVLRTVPQTQAVGRAAMLQLLDATFILSLTSRPGLSSAIPDGTRLLGLSIEHGIATVNLSGEFATGGSLDSIYQRYAQVVYTLTQFPTVSAVLFQLDGLDSPAFLPSGIGSGSPAMRASYFDLLPAISIDDPAWGGSLRSGDHVTGSADVFEAQFRLMALDAAGRALADMPVHATCGTGCRGSFDATVAFTVTTAQRGTLRVFEPSAKDGSPINVVEYPVWLTP